MSALKLALAVDTNNPIIGDIYLGSNRNCRLTQTLAEEVAQLLYTRFRFFKGEWFLNLLLGIPYYQSILGQKVSLAIVTRILQSVVQTCPGVASVQTFALTPQPQRGLLVVFSCTLADGTTLKSSDFAPFTVGS